MKQRTNQRIENKLKDPDLLQKHAYSNILKITPPKPENFQIKTLVFFIFLLKT